MKSDELIETLANELTPVRPRQAFALYALYWLVLAAIIGIIAVLVLGGIRHNLPAALSNSFFLAQNACAIAALLFSLCAAFLLAIPDRKPSRIALVAISFSAVFWIAMIALNLAGASVHSLAEDWHASGTLQHCIRNFILIGVFPFLALLFMVRRAASTFPGLTGLSVFIAAASLSAVCMRVLCPVDEASHIVLSHDLPVLVISVLGWVIGGKLLKW